MISLYLDTTDLISKIGLKRDGRVVKKIEWQANKSLGDDLLPNIMKLLKSAECKLSDLHLIEVNIGPGSFTGTRIGVTVANTLAWSLNIPVVALPLLQGEGKGEVSFDNFTKGVVPHYSAEASVTERKKV